MEIVVVDVATCGMSIGDRRAPIALQQVTAHPELMRRNPALLQRAWEMQAEHRGEFIAQVGPEDLLDADSVGLDTPTAPTPSSVRFCASPASPGPGTGEKLLRRDKKAYFDGEPTPSMSVIGERLVELLRTR